MDKGKYLTILMVVVSPSFVLAQPPFYFNYQQPQHPRFPQNTYQPFTNAPNYYQPTFQSHSPGGRGEEAGSADILNNFFNGELTHPTPQSSSPLVTYPTQVTTIRGGPSQVNLSPQQYQPVGNSIFQQTPTTQTTPFRPSPLINHHTHVVNGLPRQQFFGNNYDFFRQRHGLTLLPTTTGPFHQPTGTPLQPSPTPSILLSATSTAQPPVKPNEPKSTAVKFVDSPKPTQPTIVSTFPNFNYFSPASSPSSKPTATTATPTRSIPKAQPTTASTSVGVSPSFGFSQYFPEVDSNGSNELIRQPLFEAEDDDIEDDDEDDDSYTLNNGNSVFNDKRRPLPTALPPSPSQIPFQRTASPLSYATEAPATQYKSLPYSNAVNSVNTGSIQTKNESPPVRVHNTQPIRIVFNYEQALEALQENPGVRVVVAHTEKNNLTQDEYTTTTARPSYYSPVTTPRPSQVLYQTTTGRPLVTATYRPVSSTQRTQPSPVPTRFDYEPGTYTATGRTTTTAAALENLALELEGRRDSTGRPLIPSPRPSLIETVATFATEPTQTENPLQTYRKGSKKYVVVPNGNLYKVQEPRVVVNDLANIVVQDLPRGFPPYSRPTQPSFPIRSTYTEPPTYPTRSYYQQQPTFPVRPSINPQYDDAATVGQPISEDLRQEIDNLNQQIQQEIETTTQEITTTPPPPPRIRVTTPAPRLLKITTYRPPGTYRTTPRQAPVSVVEEEEDEGIDEIPENGLGQSQDLKKNQPSRYYYNNKQRGGLSGAYQRYEYNGVDSPSSTPSPVASQPEERTPKVVRRRQRVRGRLVAGSPPRPVQVSTGRAVQGPVIISNGAPAPVQVAPAPPGTPLAAISNGAAIPGPVFRVGPRGRLLRRKIRPRNQQPTAVTTVQEARPSPSSAPFAPSPTSPAFVRDLPPVPQEISSEGPILYSPTPFIPTSVPFPVTTFRPGPSNLLVQQNLAANDDNDDSEDDRREVDRPATFRSRFRFTPTSSTARAPVHQEDDEESNQYESDEEAPVVPQRRRPQFSTTTSSTEKPSSNQIISDRANILQRQIRFNRNRKNQKSS